MIVFKSTCLIDGLIYIGQTTKDPKKRYFGSGKLIRQAIKKYGKENFTRETLRICETQCQLDFWEIHYIKKFNSRDPLIGLNMKKGGEKPPLFAILKAAEQAKLRVGDKNGMYGKTPTEKVRRYLSIIFSG